ncbi:MAG: peptidoglycan D,D-transpeptidase FtsI family protein [Armatimonadota bacterium]
MVVIVCLFIAIAGRLIFIQLCKADQYAEWAKKLRFTNIHTLTTRGSIYDRAGRPLAMSIMSASIYANTREVINPALTAQRLASLIGGQPEEYRRKIKGGKDIVWLVRKIDPRYGYRVKRGYRVVIDGGVRYKTIPGIGVWFHKKRVYPEGPAAAHVLGFVNIEGKPLAGIEWQFDNILSNRDGLMRAEVDVRDRVIPWAAKEVVSEPKDGKDLFLTIDLVIQFAAEAALKRVAEKFHPESACAIVLDPRNGDILAMANYPSFDPNAALKFSSSTWANRAVAHRYEPGSTLKAVTVAAALNEGISPNGVLTYCTGKMRVGNSTIRCSLHHPFERGHGAVNMSNIIKYSCNIGAAELAMRLGADKLRRYEEAFGLLSKPGAGFSFEAVGYVPKADQWSTVRLANVAFGQGIAVTPLHMASVYATIANGGVYVSPRIVRGIGANGKLVRYVKMGRCRRVVSARVASQITRMLVDCVENGTGKNAKLQGYSVAGKTGSAQVADPKGRGYLPDAVVASFIGFVPAERPRFVIAVVVNRPKGSHFGATVAAPAFRDIAEKALRYYRVPFLQSPVRTRLQHKDQSKSKGLV